MNRKSKNKTEKSHTKDKHKDKHKNDHQIEAAAHAMTFAEMLRLQPEARRRLKLPPWLTFKLPYERKDQAVLTEIEQQRFLCAFNVINSNGVLGQLVDIHGEPSHLAHSQQRFLPWHRIYLLKFEQALRAIHPDVSLPYWDWTQASEQEIPAWLQSFTPTVVTPTQTISVTRFPQSQASLATIASNTPGALAQTDFTSFTSQWFRGFLSHLHKGRPGPALRFSRHNNPKGAAATSPPTLPAIPQRCPPW